MKRPNDIEELRGLVGRIRVMTPNFESGMSKLNQWMSGAKAGSYVCSLILGESGTGKTVLLEMFAAKHPAARDGDGIVRPVMFVETPHHPTVIAVLEAMLRALGDPRPEKGSRTQKMVRLEKLLAEQGVKLILLDDLQHMVDKNQNVVLYDSAECLKEIMVNNRVGIIGSGLVDSELVVKSNEQLKRRFVAPFRVPRFDWSDADSQDVFLGVLREFRAQLSMFELPRLEGDEMSLRMYLATGGLIDFVAKILRQAIWNALDKGTRRIAMPDLGAARNDALFEVESLSDNPFDANFNLRKNGLAEKLASAKKINQRVARPVSKRSAIARGHLAQIGL
jgi:Bacterial TniB protein